MTSLMVNTEEKTPKVPVQDENSKIQFQQSKKSLGMVTVMYFFFENIFEWSMVSTKS